MTPTNYSEISATLKAIAKTGDRVSMEQLTSHTRALNGDVKPFIVTESKGRARRYSLRRDIYNAAKAASATSPEAAELVATAEAVRASGKLPARKATKFSPKAPKTSPKTTKSAPKTPKATIVATTTTDKSGIAAGFECIKAKLLAGDQATIKGIANFLADRAAVAAKADSKRASQLNWTLNMINGTSAV